MRGSIRELVKGKRYELRISLGKDPVSGRYRQKSISVRGTRTEAKRALRAALTELEKAGQVGAPGAAIAQPRATGDVTFGQLLDEWMTYLEAAGRSPTTLSRYRSTIELHLKPILGDQPLDRLTVKAFDDMYREQLRRLKPATVMKNHLVARAALDRARRWGWIVQNVAELAEVPKVRRTKVRPPGTEDVLRLLALAEDTDPTFAVYLRLGAATGARRGELCALRWSDIDLRKRSVTIERGVIIVPGGVLEKDTKTSNTRTVALDEGTVAALLEHRDRERGIAASHGIELAFDAFLFSRRPGGALPMRPDNCTSSFEKLRRRAGLRGFSLKDATRHLAATRLIGAGVDVRTVAGRLGHARASTTLDIYSHFLPERDRHAAEVLGEFLDPTVE